MAGAAIVLAWLAPGAPVAVPPVEVGRQPSVYRSGVDLVHVAATVVDRKGASVATLAADDFEIYEDGRRQTIEYFAAGDPSLDGPHPEMHLGLALDVSGSMGEDMPFTKTAAIKFVNTLIDAVDVTVVDFDAEVRSARYGRQEHPRLVERIRLQKAGGFTALYDAVGLYLDGAAGQPGRKVLLLYTDGGDTRSSITKPELLDLLRASDATVYAIGELEHQSPSGRTEARLLLQQIAEITGGQAFFPASIGELDAVYEKVVTEIRAQYTLGYVATNARADGTWRKVEVRIAKKDGRDLRVRARKGYFAPFRKP
jgi:Ca-activated chloride channel homolog